MSEKSFVKLTEAEIAERSRRLAHAVAQVESLQDEKKESAKEFNKRSPSLPRRSAAGRKSATRKWCWKV